MNRPGSLYFSAVAVYCFQTDFMMGPTIFGSLTGPGSVPCACAETSSFFALAASSPPAFSAAAQRTSVGSVVNAGLPLSTSYMSAESLGMVRDDEEIERP